jgi:hypothetical protein
MRFPKDKANVLALARTVNKGMGDNATTFSRPPVAMTDMETLLANYDAKRAEITAAEAHVKQLYEDEGDIYDDISGGTQRNIKYGESIAGGDEATLALFGWGNPRPRQPLLPPGQARALEIIGQGDGWVQVDWKEPVGGGKPVSYIVRRAEDGSDFVDAKTETASESILLNQPTGRKLTYQVVAINRAGESMASNTVALVL